MTSTSLLHLDGIAQHFGGLSVLSNVIFSVQAGSITGLIGPNGSGKTTCFNIISGFLRPASGRVSLDGHDITELGVQERSRRGMLRTFQTPKVFEHMSVIENVMVGCHQATHSGMLSTMFRTSSARREFAETRQQADEVCEKFNLRRVENTKAGQLPVGQRRIVELARAYIARPRLLLLDEPSSGLSSVEIEALREWIVTLNAEGLTILLVSHDMGLMSVANIVNVLYFGEVIATGSMDAIQQNARVRDAYLGM